MTPDCSTCGYAVEWLRSCFQSAWCLSDDLTLQTPGRFVFCPDDTPVFPGWHYLESRDWTSDERGDIQGLGEVTTQKRKWHSGLAPYPFPLATVVGSIPCLAGPQELPYACPPTVVSDCNPPLPPTMFVQVVSADGVYAEFAGFKAPIIFGIRFSALGWFCDTPAHIGIFPGTMSFMFRCVIGTIYFTIIRTIDGVNFVFGPPVAWNPANPSPVPLYYIFPDFGLEVGRIQVKVTLQDPDDVPPDPRSFVGGFDKRCYAPFPGLDLVVPDINLRADQIRFAKAQTLLYDDPAAAGVFVQDWLGPTAVVTVVPDSASVVPGSIIAVRPDLTVVIISGTTNLEQVVSYTTFFVLGTTDLGPFSTNMTWFTSAAAIQARITAAGADPTGRIILSGHSYGGAIATLGAAAYATWNPARAIDLITFGGPKAGDSRLVDKLETVRVVRISNRFDPVPSMPPRGIEVINFVGALGQPLIFGGWDIFRHKTGQLIIETSGDVTESDESTADFGNLVGMVAAYLIADPMPIPFAHSAGEYLRRLSIIQPT